MVKLNRQHGFTLIEILVAISIVGIIVTMLTAGFAVAQKRSRDAKRRADILAVQKSLEQCYALNQVYPDGNVVNSGSALTCGTQTTMNMVPYDSKGTGSYVYTYTVNATGTSYCYCGYMEQVGSGNASTEGAGGNCSYGGTKDYQCAGSQQ